MFNIRDKTTRTVIAAIIAILFFLIPACVGCDKGARVQAENVFLTKIQYKNEKESSKRD